MTHLPPIEGSSPKWRIPARQKAQGQEWCTQNFAMKRGLTGFLVEDDGKDWKVGGKKTYEQRMGEETPWAVKPRPRRKPSDIDTKHKGKRYGIAPVVLEKDLSESKKILDGPASQESSKLFQYKRHDHNPPPSSEYGHDETIGRKRNVHGHTAQRNGIGLATLGDKPYAEPSYSSGYFVHGAANVPKCGVEKVPVPHGRLHPLKATGPSYELHSEIEAVRNLPKLPKDKA